MIHTFKVIVYQQFSEGQYKELKKRKRIRLSVNENYQLEEMFKDNGQPYKDRCLLIIGDEKYIIAESYDLVNDKIKPVVVRGFGR